MIPGPRFDQNPNSGPLSQSQSGLVLGYGSSQRAGFKIRRIFFGAERSGGAVFEKASGAERSDGAVSMKMVGAERSGGAEFFENF